MTEVQLRQCIITTNRVRGKGIPESPLRKLTEVYLVDNEGQSMKIAEHDPNAPVYNVQTGLWVFSKEQAEIERKKILESRKNNKKDPDAIDKAIEKSSKDTKH